MSEPKPIAVVSAQQGYEGLHQAMRARAEELGIARDQIDELASLTRGHASKLLSPYPMKAIGRTTLGPMLYALKLKLLVVADDDVIWVDEPKERNASQARCSKPLQAGTANMPEVRTLQRKIKMELARKIGRKGGLKSGKARRRKPAKIPRWKRRSIARKAARARWRKASGALRHAVKAPSSPHGGSPRE